MAPMMFPVVPGQTPNPEVLQALAQSLAEGEVLALPTETCYGLAVRADAKEGLATLAGLKGRPEERAFSLHLGSLSDARSPQNWHPWKAICSRLASEFWPGPLTQVLRLDSSQARQWQLDGITREGRIGIRIPDHPATQALLGLVPFPVVMTSANVSGQAPMTDANQVADAFGPKLAGILDGGPTRLGSSSTVLLLESGRIEILRNGAIALEDARSVAGLRILFVCTGNTCRSPMAEALAQLSLSNALGVLPDGLKAFGFSVASAGVFAAAGAPATSESVQAVEELGLDLNSHQSTPIQDALSSGVDQIYCLTASHQAALESILPSDHSVSIALLRPDGLDIPDPIGGPLRLYQKTRDAIAQGIAGRMAEWV